MKNKLTILLIFCCMTAFAQGGALADLKFEEAEIAFNNQEYETTIKKLDEFDKLLGSVSSSSLYLRIIASDYSLDYIKNYDSKEMITFEKEVKAYLKSFNDTAADEKFRDVYKISKKIENSNKIKKWAEAPEYKEGKKEFDSKNYIEALEWLNKAANKNNALAMTLIGTIHSAGEAGVKQDFTKAIDWWTKASENGEIQASYAIGLMYYYGLGLTKNDDLALKYFSSYAEMGMKEPMRMLGLISLSKKKYTDAEYWFRRAAKKGDADAMNDLGNIYYWGKGVQIDYNEALKCYKLSSESTTSTFSGNIFATNNIGNMYYLGNGVQQDYQEALKYYKKAAEQGNTYGYVNIGNMYLEGKGVEKNIEEAIYYFIKVEPSNFDKQHNAPEDAKKGLAKACYSLAEKYFKNSQYTEALANYKKAYSYGNANAKYKISEIYKEGLGIEKDKKQAKEWLNK